MKKPEITDEPGRFAYVGLDRVIHEKARLGILTSLASHSRGLRFNELKALCSLTDGNLNRHLQPLQEAKLIEVQKDGAGRGQSTICRITPLGRRRFAEYLSILESIVVDALPATQSSPGKVRPALRLP
jgi:DNA-binding HxlR family transcriptional regulator